MRRFFGLTLILSLGAVALSAQTTALSAPTASSILTPTAATPTLNLTQGTASGDEGDTSMGPALTGALDTPDGRVALAMTTLDYQVTPGDIYTLTFITANGPVTSSLIVDADCLVNLANLGKIDAASMRLVDLRKAVEKKVLEAYPLSAPQLIIASCGLFPVYTQGEVKKSSTTYCWGLSRLSSLWGGVTPYASNRAIFLKRGTSAAKTYDLFKVWRTGDLGQDPYLRPSDTVIFSRYERQIALSGAVRRPGSYQLLPGEELKDLVETYGDGFIETAKPELSTLIRRSSATLSEGSILRFDARDRVLPNLVDGDAIDIPSMETYLPVVYFEGAIGTGTETAKQYATDRQPYREGDLLSRSLRTISNNILPSADLKRAFISRKGLAETIPVNLERLLYAYDIKDDVALQPEDRVVIPFGSLDIFVTGEVLKSSWVNAGVLVRLHEAVGPLLTRYSSIRNVAVCTESGQAMTYDLFKAERYGDLSQDPFLKPGDTVTVHPLQRLVTIAGEVKRPGSYQLLEGEELRNLVEVYGGGYTEKANPMRLSLVRYVSATSLLGEKRIVDYAKETDLRLSNYDSIIVPPSSDLLPCVYFEGALGVGVNGEDPQAAKRVPYTFYPGETLSSAVQKLRAQFSAVSDLKNAYLLRDTNRTPVDLAKFLYDKDYSNDIPFAASDTIVVPFRQFFVSVSGAVQLPGRYPYVPDRDWAYYIGLAGGFDEDKNVKGKISIIGKNGETRAKGGALQPEDTIVAASNSFSYFLGKATPIVSTIASLMTIIAEAYVLVK